MFSGMPLSFLIIAGIACLIIGLAVLAQSKEPGLGFALVCTAIVLFVVSIGRGCDEIKSHRTIAKKPSAKEIKVECKGSNLCDKLEELVELRQKLVAKKGEINGLINEYRSSIKQIEDEILAEKKKKNINSYSTAKNNQRIKYDLALIQRKSAYIAKLEEMLPKLENGANELEYLQRQTEDDVKMEKVLGKKEIDKLAKEIEKSIAKYLPDADKLVVKVDESKLESPEAIWNKIAGGR